MGACARVTPPPPQPTQLYRDGSPLCGQKRIKRGDRRDALKSPSLSRDPVGQSSGLVGLPNANVGAGLAPSIQAPTWELHLLTMRGP